MLATLHEDKQLFPFVAFDEGPEHVELVTQVTHRIILAQLVRGGVGGVLMHRHVPAKSRKNHILADVGVDSTPQENLHWACKTEPCEVFDRSCLSG